MGYVLLGVESLAVSLLFVATAVASIGRLGRRLSHVALFTVVLVAVCAVFGLCALAALRRTDYRRLGTGLPDWLFYGRYVAALVIAGGVGAWLFLGSVRRGRAALAAVVGLLPLAAYAAMATITGLTRAHFASKDKWFVGTLIVAAAYIAGALWIRVVGLRAGREGLYVTRAAAWPRGRLALALAAALALHLITFWNLDLAAKGQLAEVRAQAAGLALSVAPARVPHSQNAAPIYEAAFEALDPHSFPQELNKTWYGWVGRKAEGVNWHDPDLRQFLKERAPALALLREAAARPGCHFEHDYHHPSVEMLLPELAPFRTAARLLALDARCHAADGDVRGALDDVTAFFAMAEHASANPALVASLVAILIDSMAGETLEAVLAADRPALEDLVRLHLNEGVSYQRVLDRAMRMEEAFRLSFFCDAAANPRLLAQIGSPRTPVPRWGGFYRVFILQADLAAHGRVSARMRELTAKPYAEARQGYADLEREMVEGPAGFLTRVLIPAVGRAVAASVQADARRNAVRLGVAAYRYRLERGRFPERPEDLAPDFIFPLPTDPFDGKPMRLKRTEQGLVVYSIGPDLTDNGGAPYESKNQTGDITFGLPD